MENPTNYPTKPSQPDPFGRLMPNDGSQDRFQNLTNLATLDAPVGPNDDSRPDDVAKVEIMLDQIGLLDLRQTDGPTGFYGERLRQAIMALQHQQGLTGTGRIIPGDATHTALQAAGNGNEKDKGSVLLNHQTPRDHTAQ